MSYFDPVYSSHPIFKAFQSSVIAFERVEKVSSRGVLQERFLVIAFSGIFLLKHRSFPRGFYISRAIPLCDLTSIVVTDNNFTCHSPKVSFTVSHPKYIQLAAYAHSIHRKLFDHPSISYTLEIDQSKKARFERSYYNLVSESLLADRFIGCVFHYNSELSEQDLHEAYDILKEYKDEVDITSDLLTNPNIGAIVHAISFDTKITSLRLKSFGISQFIPHFLQIIRNSKSISRVVLSYITFQPPLKELETAFTGAVIPAKEFIFDHCQFQFPDSSSFFKGFSDYQYNITLLSFQKCKFSQQVLDSLFQSIFFFQCFHTLSTLQINDVNLPDDLVANLNQLSCCGWILETHCLLNLSMANSNIKIGQVFSQLLQFDAGYITLDFSGNHLTKPMQSISSFQSVRNIVLQNVTFHDNTLFSLFDVLSRADSQGIRLDLSNAKVSNWSDFFAKVSNLVIPTLEGLVWDSNPLSPTHLSSFCTFAKKQPQLKELSISHCFSKSDIKSAQNLLHNLVRAKPLEAFSFEGSNDRFLGPAMTPLLDVLLSQQRIVSLNITNQRVGENALILIAEQMPLSMKEIRFSGYGAPNADSIIRVCTKFIEKQQLSFVSWPAIDEKPALAKTEKSIRAEKSRSMMLLRQQYIIKYGKEATSSEIDSEMAASLITRYSFNASHGRLMANSNSSGSSILSSLNEKKKTISENMETIQKYIDYDQATIDLLKECGDVEGNDPIGSIMERINMKYSLQNLMQNIGC